MLKALFVAIVLFLFINPLYCGEIIVAREIESYFYIDGKMERSSGQYENTYHTMGNQITRVKVHDYKNNKTQTDDTGYMMITGLVSDPNINRGYGESVTRAIGYPGADSLEMLVLGNNFIQTVRSTSKYFVICRFKIIKVQPLPK